MKFKLDEDEEIIYEPKIKFTARCFVIIEIICLIAFIFGIRSNIVNGYNLEAIILFFAILFISRMITFKIVLTNKRLIYKNLFFLNNYVDLEKIISIGLYYFPSNGSYFTPKDFGIDALRIKIEGSCLRTWLFVQDGKTLRAKILNSIYSNINNNKLKQGSIEKSILYKIGLIK